MKDEIFSLLTLHSSLINTNATLSILSDQLRMIHTWRQITTHQCRNIVYPSLNSASDVAVIPGFNSGTVGFHQSQFSSLFLPLCSPAFEFFFQGPLESVRFARSFRRPAGSSDQTRDSFLTVLHSINTIRSLARRDWRAPSRAAFVGRCARCQGHAAHRPSPVLSVAPTRSATGFTFSSLSRRTTFNPFIQEDTSRPSSSQIFCPACFHLVIS